MYILLFTCLNIRAVPLELVNDMSTHSVVLYLAQFFNLYAIHSQPQKMLGWISVHSILFFHPSFNTSLFWRDPEKLYELTPPSREVLLECLELIDLYLKGFPWSVEWRIPVEPKDLFQIDYKCVDRVGDLVVVKNPIKSWPYWSLGRVMEVTPGDDDFVWLAKIRKPDGKVQEQLIKHLYSWELLITHSHQAVNSPSWNCSFGCVISQKDSRKR